jgi:hypothetical protein
MKPYQERFRYCACGGACRAITHFCRPARDFAPSPKVHGAQNFCAFCIFPTVSELFNSYVVWRTLPPALYAYLAN